MLGGPLLLSLVAWASGCLVAGPGDSASGCRSIDPQEVTDEQTGWYGLPPLAEVPRASEAVYELSDGGVAMGTLSLDRRDTPTAVDQERTQSAPPEVECLPLYWVPMELSVELDDVSFSTLVELEFDPDFVQRSYVSLVYLDQIETDLDLTDPVSGAPALSIQLQLTQAPDGWVVDMSLNYEDSSEPWLTLDALEQ